MKEHPYNLGRWPGQDAPLIDAERLKYCHKNGAVILAARRKRCPGRRKKP